MLLAPIVLAAALGQACPEPSSRYGPPPCAAANVPGCLPGYHRTTDDLGRTIYVCNRNVYRPAPSPAPEEAPQAPFAPEPYAQSQPPPGPAPAPYAPRYAPQPWQPPSRAEHRGQLGFVLMPGGTSFDRGHTTDTAGAAGLELRGPFGGGRLRLGFEYARDVRVADVTLKWDFNDRGQIRPFLAVGAGAARLMTTTDRSWRPTASVSLGVDLFVARDLFFTLEAKQRAFTHDTATGLELSSLHQTSLFAGIGIYL